MPTNEYGDPQPYAADQIGQLPESGDVRPKANFNFRVIRALLLEFANGFVTSVAGRQGEVVLTKADVGLENVNNTSDLDKPVSSLQQLALDEKAFLLSPDFQGIPLVPDPDIEADNRQIVNAHWVNSRIQELIATGDVFERFDYYIDPDGGSDLNSGTSPDEAFETPLPLNALALSGAIPNGVEIGVKAGTQIFERLKIIGPSNAKINNVYIAKYGMGANPIFDCRAPILSWTKTPGYENLYEAPITLPGDVKILGNAWVDETMIVQVGEIQDCEDTPGTFYVGVPNWKLTSTKIYVHTEEGGEPSSAVSWRYSQKANGIHVTGDNTYIRNVESVGNASQDGSIVVEGKSARIENCKVRDGCRHSMYVKDGAYIDTCYFYRGRNDLEDPGFANSIVCNEAITAGTSWQTKNCTFDAGGTNFTGPLCHGANESNLFGSQTHTGDIYIGMSGIATANSTSAVFDGCIFEECLKGITQNSGVTMTLKNSSGSVESSVVSANNINTSTSLSISNNSFTINKLDQGAVLSLSPNAFYTVSGGSNTWNILDTKFPVTSSPSTLYRVNKGYVSITGDVIGPRFVFSFPLFSIGATGGTSTLSLTNCVIPLGSDFTVNGVTYKSIPDLQAAGMATGCTYTPVDSPVVETFDVADANLEDLPGWTRIGGVAGQAAVRSNKLALINTNQTAYVRNENLSSDHFAHCIVAGLTSASGNTVQPLAVRIGNQSNFVAAQWSNSSGNYAVRTFIAGTPGQPIATTVNPAIGDELYLVVRDKACMLIINGRSFKSANISADALMGYTQAGVIARNFIVNPVLDNFSCGSF